MYKDLRVCLVLLLAALVAGCSCCQSETIYMIDGKEVKFDFQYYPEAGGWLKLHIEPYNWAEARLRCDREGAVLASPLNTKLSSAMTNIMAKIVNKGIFSGIHATISKGNYFSVEGVPLTKIPITWAPNEPDNLENSEDCLVMLTNGTMADVKCTDAFPYVCYKKNISLVMGSCGADSDYQLNTKTGSCYKFHKLGQTWPQAYMTCATEGGYLTIINSEVESEVLKELYAQYPDRVITADYTGSLFIGFHDWSNHNTWRTVHGETLQAAGFDKWMRGEPNNARNNEYCGSIIKPGLLNDVPCNAILPFVCEKSPTSISSDSRDDDKLQRQEDEMTTSSNTWTLDNEITEINESLEYVTEDYTI